MDKDFCRQIDEEDLIEKYIAGKLHGELLNRLTEHLQECIDHSNAVNLEKALSRGVRDFARSELKSNLRNQIKKHEISKYYILRYAAILIVAIMAPIVLYYQLVSTPTDLPNIAEQQEPPSEIVQADESVAVEPQLSPIKSTSAAKKTAAAPVQEATETSLSKGTRSRPAAKTTDDHFLTPPSDKTDTEKIKDILKSNENEIISCIPESERNLLNRIGIEIHINKNGSIKDLKIESENQLGDEGLKCLKEMIHKLEFPVVSKPLIVKKEILISSD
jgi:hypothetical protein